MMPNRPHNAATVTTESAESKKYRPGRDLYLACRGGLIARGLGIVKWAEENDETRQSVEAALTGLSNSERARSIRARLAGELGLALEES